MQSRKQFLRSIMAGLGITLASPLLAATQLKGDDVYKLSNEQQELLIVYKKWLEEFNLFINNQKQDFTSSENNKKLLHLAEEANEWKTQLAQFMNDKYFAAYYKTIIAETTEAIL